MMYEGIFSQLITFQETSIRHKEKIAVADISPWGISAMQVNQFNDI